MTCRLDHIVFGCADLEEGAMALAAALDAPPTGRGRHQRMSTHNALWNMGDAYIELVAIDPAAPRPGRPRWFGLDDPAVQARFADGPRLLTWAVATDSLEALRARAPAPLGPIESFARDNLTWNAAVPEGGVLAEDGAYPLTIQWTSGLHPAKGLADIGIRCRELVVSHPRIDAIAAALGPVEGPVRLEAGPPRLHAALQTPAGAHHFDS